MQSDKKSSSSSTDNIAKFLKPQGYMLPLKFREFDVLIYLKIYLMLEKVKISETYVFSVIFLLKLLIFNVLIKIYFVLF